MNNSNNTTNPQTTKIGLGGGGGGGCCAESALDYNVLPDACTNIDREDELIRKQQRDANDPQWLNHVLERDSNLAMACAVMLFALNTTTGRYILYPFMIFSTWVHEMCHGIAALIVGGYIAKLEIFKDGSGLCWTGLPYDGEDINNTEWKRGFIAAGGYPGTAVVGCILLLFRRTTLGPTIGTIGLGVCIVLSCLLWVRNTWGFIALLIEGMTLIGLGWKLQATHLDALYNFLAATCALNAFTSINDLFAASDYIVGGEIVTTSDAHTVAEQWGHNYKFWATTWLITSFILTFIGIVFAFNAKHFRFFKVRKSQQQNHTTVDNHDNNATNNAAVTNYYGAPPSTNTQQLPQYPTTAPADNYGESSPTVYNSAGVPIATAASHTTATMAPPAVMATPIEAVPLY